jgi:hypothetical protein
LHIRVTTDHTVERHDIGVWQGVCSLSEVPEDELSGESGVASAKVAARSIQIIGRRVSKRDAGQACASEFNRDYPNSRAHIEKVEPL